MKQKKPYNYDGNPKRYLWSLSHEQLKQHFPDKADELLLIKKQYHKTYYEKNKGCYNMKRKYNVVLKELLEQF